MTRFTAISLTLLTGFSGLVYELAWQQLLVTLLGSYAEAMTAALVVFFGALAIGYAFFGRATRRIAQRAARTGHRLRLLRFYALTQAGIGAYALLFPWLFGAVQFISLHLPSALMGLGFAFDMVAATLLIAPLAMLMGGTIPILTLALAGTRARATRVHAWIYGASSGGAFAGAVAGVFILIPELGLDGTFYAMASVNLLVGLAYMLLDRSGGQVETEPGSATEISVSSIESFGVYAIVCVLAGFATMALQVTLGRVGLLALGPAHHGLAIVIAVFALSTALGSLCVSAFRTIPRSVIVCSQWALVVFLFLLYSQIENAPYWAYALRSLFHNAGDAFLSFYMALFACAFVVLALPISLAGALLPLLFNHLRGELGELGSVAGRLYSWNAVGSLLGVLFGGYLLLFWLDLHHVYRVVMAALVVESALLTVLIFRAPSWATAAFVVSPALMGLLILPTWAPERLTAGLFHQREEIAVRFQGPDAYFATKSSANRLIYFQDGPTATVSVREGAEDRGRPRRTLFSNGEPEGTLDLDYSKMALAALIPAFFAERPERAFVIGFGTGVTVSELASLQSIREVEVVEASSGVIDAAPLFNKGNMNALKSPKLTITRGDAFRILTRSEQSYDIILSASSSPWVAGTERLYSVEFLDAVRGRLSPGGVYAQWIKLDFLNFDTLKLVLHTYASAFPHVSVWYTAENDLLLLGFDAFESALDVRAIEDRLGQADFTAGLERAGIKSIAALFAHELLPLGTLHAAELAGPVHNLTHPILGELAARSFFQAARTALPKFPKLKSTRVGSRNSLLRRYAGAPDKPLSESIIAAAARETCEHGRSAECATLLIRWRGESDRPDQPMVLITQLREDPRNRELLHEDILSSMDVLFGNEPLPEVDGQKSLELARRVSRIYLRYYHHAVPFDRKVLRAAWDACQGSGCELVKRQVEQLTGELEGSKNKIRRRGKAARRRRNSRKKEEAVNQ